MKGEVVKVLKVLKVKGRALEHLEHPWTIQNQQRWHAP